MSQSDPSPDDPIGQKLLKYCPFCSYSLEGLPVEHRCPECGGPFDRRWGVFGDFSRWHSLGIWRRLGIIVFLIVFGILLLNELHTALGHHRMFSRAHLPWQTGGLAMGIFTWFVFTRPPHFVAVGSTGVFVCSRRSRDAEHITWNRIGGVGSLHWRGLPVTIDGKLRHIDAWRGNTEQYKRFRYALESNMHRRRTVVPDRDLL